MEALFLLESQFPMGAEHDLQVAGEIFFAKQIGNAANAVAFLAGNLQQGRILAGDLRDCGVAQETHHLAGEVRGAVTFTDQMINVAEDFFRPAFGNGLHHLLENVGGRRSDQIPHRVGRDLICAGRDGLVEDGEGIAHGAVAGLG